MTQTNNKGKEKEKEKVPEEVLLLPFNPMWILRPTYHYIYFRDKVFAKKDVFVPANNANGHKFLQFLKMNAPLDLTKSYQKLQELNLDENCLDKIELPKQYTNVLYLAYQNGKLYQDSKARPGLVGYTTNKFRPEKVLGVCSFRTFVFTGICKVTAFIFFSRFFSEAVSVRKRQKELYKEYQT